MRAADDLHEADVDPIGEAGMAFDRRTEPRHRGGLDRWHPQHRVGIPHRHGTDLDRLAPHLEPVARGRTGSLERQRARVEIRHPHFHGDWPGCGDLCPDQPAGAVQGQRVAVQVLAAVDQGGDAASAIAALLDLYSVGVEYAVEHLGARTPRGFQHQGLIEPYARMPVCEPPQLVGGGKVGAGRHLEHDKVVA